MRVGDVRRSAARSLGSRESRTLPRATDELLEGVDRLALSLVGNHDDGTGCVMGALLTDRAKQQACEATTPA